MQDLAILESLCAKLFTERETNVYAVFDGAAMHFLRELIWERQPEYMCLYAGDLSVDMAAVAPYLVKLERGSRFTDIALMRGWGKSRGIFAITPAMVGLADLGRHLRTFLIVKDTAGRRLYFRYYDPRVLRAYLPTCTPDELDYVFGPIRDFILEDADCTHLLQFSRQGGTLVRDDSALAAESA